MSIEDKYLALVPVRERDEFFSGVKNIARSLDIPPVWLLAVMWHESGLNPAAFEPKAGGGGLIGFMPSTAAFLGTSVDALRKMSRLEQLPYVYKYFARSKKKFRDFTDFYLYDFYPDAIGKPNWYVIGIKKGSRYANLVAKLNPVFDTNKDGYIKLGELKKYIAKKFPEIYRRDLAKKILWYAAIVLLVLLFIALVVIIYINRKSILS